MGLALCHSLPRDLQVQVTLLLFFVALILQAAAIGLHARNDGGGYFTMKGTSSARSNALVLLAAHPTTYIPPTSALHPGGGTAATKLCNPSAAVLTYSCARFAESFHIVDGLTLSSFITNVVVLVLGVFVVVRLSHSTLGLLFRLTYLACVPAALQCAAVGCFFARTVPHARLDTASAAGASYDQIKYHRRPAADLMIAATALLCAGFLVIFTRWVVVIRLRQHFEAHKEHTKGEVKQMMEAHMVNDDWTRQKQILLSHARSVQVEMAVKNPHKAERVLLTGTTRTSEPFPPRPIDTDLEKSHQTDRHAKEDSDDGTLHFRAASNVTPLIGHGGLHGGKGEATFDITGMGQGSTSQTPPPPPSGAQAGKGNQGILPNDDTHAFSDADTREGCSAARYR